MTRTTSRTPGRYHHGNLRNAVLETALSLIHRRGLQGWTLREVARRAGVSSAAPYQHFRSKDAVLFAIAAEGFGRLRDELRAAGANAADPLSRFRALGTTFVRFARTHPEHYRAMFAAEPDKRRDRALHRLARETFGEVEETVTACQRAGVVVRGDARQIAMAAWTLLHGFMDAALSQQLAGLEIADEEVEPMAERLTVLLYLGLAPRG